MPPKGKKHNEQNLGRALQRRHVHNLVERAARENAIDIDGSAARGKLVSVLEMTSLDDFLASAMLADRTFEAQNGMNAVMVDSTGQIVSGGVEESAEPLEHGTFEQLTVPRRPHWTEEMTAEELDQRERESFLAWRRGIADVEEARTTKSSQRVTPFEKNLEVWRQLWRVLERSDLLVQIVDARNPLFFYSDDLHRSAQELAPPRPMVILVNKSDFLSRKQRRFWAEYFGKRGWPCLFFSARSSQEKLNEEVRAQARAAEQGLAYVSDDEGNAAAAVAEEESDSEEEEDVGFADVSDSEDGGSSVSESDVIDRGNNTTAAAAAAETPIGSNKDEGEAAAAAAAVAAAAAAASLNAEESDSQAVPGDSAFSAVTEVLEKGGASDEVTRVLSREELLAELDRRALLARPENEADSASRSAKDGGRRCVGMVGYPNVGKSSVINVLLGATPFSHDSVRVSVAATPGKTKHFQTLPLTPTLLLCDCPGLVFPSFVSSAAEMVCAGVLPITQTRDHTAPAALIAERVPRSILELAYTIKLPPPKVDATPAGSAAAAAASPSLRPVPPPPSAEELLTTLGRARGYFRGASLGEPDWPRTARLILRDYTEGRLLFCHAPPTLSAEELSEFLKETEKTALRSTKLARKLEKRRLRAEGASASAAATMANRVASGAATGHAEAGSAHSEMTGGVKKPTRREQGRKKWGKKGKKMSDPRPYEDKGVVPGGEKQAAAAAAEAAAMGPGRKGKHYGAKSAEGFSRAVLPHHESYNNL